MSINSTATPGEAVIEVLPWNNPSNILSIQDYQGTVYYYNVVMKPVVVVAGVATNIVNCLVFRRQGLKDRMNLCLFVLALIDIVYLLYCMIFTVTYWMKILDPVLGEEFYQITFCYAGGVCSGLRETSTSVSVLIAVERCVCVVFPLRANSFMTTRTMGILLAAIVVGMQLAFIMTPLKRFVFPVYDNTTGMTMWKVARSATWQDNEALLLYDTVDDTILLVAFPFIVFILVSGATAITVVKMLDVLWTVKAD
ncbi:uncharacterized protein LOC112565950 [Pomacea canaliculata]|uniref:uncharacterized protein LOC112565950 n=1 Tax=Pomacea canaliculata TaxID=400727 RepID=UPI000D725D30|nr:uncharacterized protein LOC112565950 [Pomacea canaliculata]